MHLSIWILLGSPNSCKEFWQRKVSVKIPTLPWTFSFRINSQKIYICTTFNIRKNCYCQTPLSVPTPFPEWNYLPIPYFFLTWWSTFPTNFTWNCMKSFYLQRIFQNIGYERTCFFNNLVLSVVKYPLFCFWIELYFPHLRKHKIPYIFLTFWPISQPFRICQPIPYLFKALKNLNLIPDFFKIFPTLGNPVPCIATQNPVRTLFVIHVDMCI